MKPDFTKEPNEPETHQTCEISHASCADSKSTQTLKGWLQNSQFENSCGALDLSMRPRKRPVPNDMKLDYVVNAYDRVRNVPCNQTAIDLSQPNKNFKDETLKLKDKIYSSSYISKSRNLNFKAETSEVRISDHESGSNNHEMKASENSFCKQATLTRSQNVERNMRIVRSSRKNSESNIFQESKEFTGECLLLNEVFMKPGPSGLCGSRNVLLDNLRSNNSVEKKSGCILKKRYDCRICDKSLDEHGKIKENYIGYIDYFCCVCRVKTFTKVALQLHGDLHCPKTLCNKCEREYTEGDTHESEHTCQVCKEKFECRTSFDRHAIDHHEYLSNLYVWPCNREIKEHSIMGDRIKSYVCCACGYEKGFKLAAFKSHNSMHRPKFYCMLCRQEYPFDEMNLHGKASICFVCKIKFDCHTLLEQHFLNHKSYFLSNCIHCKKDLINHKILCCICNEECKDRKNFQAHIFKHKNLKLFKCDVCGKRIANKYNLEQHLKNCIPLPEKCEICKARFPSKESLDKHRLEKHNVTRVELPK